MFYYELFWPLCNLIHVSTISKLLWTLIFKPLSLDEPVGQHWSLSFFQNVLLENIRNSDSLSRGDGRELSCDLPAPLCSPSQKVSGVRGCFIAGCRSIIGYKWVKNALSTSLPKDTWLFPDALYHFSQNLGHGQLVFPDLRVSKQEVEPACSFRWSQLHLHP